MEEENRKKYMWNIKDAIAQCNITRKTKTACAFIPCAYVLIVHKRKKGLEHLEGGPKSTRYLSLMPNDVQFVGEVVLCLVSPQAIS